MGENFERRDAEIFCNLLRIFLRRAISFSREKSQNSFQ